ncbi:MAG: enoyl-ACP reductase FabV [Candidatus Azotimanducaceae bacterium]|uniref:Enoyl-[acyl-carrier-protein] reductase [NADH] n=1 Tax=OM182 bacterium TaxID=2510334 RepID=A0A520S599_9GAMM|nr:enoyl-[acyl-carrier-protein] reductase FabV [Gammaproteobacteria bacterium]OUV68652.1 MAG: trans-2-enoyl-CoA reductase [Gammaproteobacteria bacterium TMED133]RZO77653.1 MAG: trans-2-enoyl-CoA reductase family protein [OM182 bacterium]
MIIEPRIKGFLCTTAHPVGCAQEVLQQIAYVKKKGPIKNGPSRVLIIGASGGYGMASRISAAFGSEASTVGVFYERPAQKKRTASPGWYKSAAFSREAANNGLYVGNINGDAYSNEVKKQTVELIKRDLDKVDMVVYSLAAPQRTLPDGTVFRSVLKPIGRPFSGVTIDINTSKIRPVSLEPASENEITETVKVMGGEDWELWIKTLMEGGALAEGCITTNYTYLGSEVTWPIYNHGTIGKAKEDLDRAARFINAQLSSLGGTARVAVMKGLLTSASSAIPGMALYLSLLYKVMKEAGSHEDCIQQTTRLFSSKLFGEGDLVTDDAGRIRMDEWELAEDIQSYVSRNWLKVTESNLRELTDFTGYQKAFLQLHGFGFQDIDYLADVSPSVAMTLVG